MHHTVGDRTPQSMQDAFLAAAADVIAWLETKDVHFNYMSGYPDYRISVWNGVAAPAALPDDVAQKLTDSLNRALGDDMFRASLAKLGYGAFRPQSAEIIAEFINAERARWSGLIKSRNISSE